MPRRNHLRTRKRCKGRKRPRGWHRSASPGHEKKVADLFDRMARL